MHSKIIQKVISGLLIFLFALSITPKSVLHDLIANHRDTSSVSSNVKGYQVSKAGFNCHFENLVVESPFITSSPAIECSGPFSFSILQNDITENFFTQYYFFSELRGPPALM